MDLLLKMIARALYSADRQLKELSLAQPVGHIRVDRRCRLDPTSGPIQFIFRRLQYLKFTFPKSYFRRNQRFRFISPLVFLKTAQASLKCLEIDGSGLSFGTTTLFVVLDRFVGQELEYPELETFRVEGFPRSLDLALFVSSRRNQATVY